MFYPHQLHRELTARREEFVRFGAAWAAQVEVYAGRLRALGERTAAEIAGAVADARHTPGALPSIELDQAGAVAVSFGVRWQSHEEARRWALGVLVERVTCAADGSQILPGRDISLPVAAVQVACFENPHQRAGDGATLSDGYRKEARFSLVTPEELLAGGGGNNGGQAGAADVVGFRRFELEIKLLCEFLERRRGWRERQERTPVAFFDGTLLFSSAQIRSDNDKFPQAYVTAITNAVRLSRDTQVPLVGFIDQSYARDLVSLLDALEGESRQQSPALYDTQLLCAATAEAAPLLSAWGDRTVFCLCQRQGLTADFLDEHSQPLVGFVYLQTTQPGGAPARLDIPAWVYQAGLLDDVLDAVRAECVVGNGYPYAIESADAAAVITAQDRAQFLRAMQEFAAREDLGFRVARKAISKVRRR